MIFELDEGKNLSNKAKHGVDFETATYVFGDPLCASRIERVVNDEERWQTIGFVEKTLLLLVAHTYRDRQDTMVIRIISARRADSHERKCYEKGTF